MSHFGEEGTWKGVSYQLSITGDTATISKGKKIPLFDLKYVKRLKTFVQMLKCIPFTLIERDICT